MASSFDSFCAIVLWAAAIWSWRMTRALRAPVRIQLRFAAVLLAALAASLVVPAPGLAVNVALIAGSVASVALALCFPEGAPAWLAAQALTLALAAGLTASLAAMPLLAFGCQAASAVAVLIVSVQRASRSTIALLGAVALFLSGLTLMDGGAAQAALLFASALSLLSRASQKPIADADAPIELAVGGKRA